MDTILMKPIRVTLVHRSSPRCMDKRMVGWWSYPVPEFEWTHTPASKGFRLDLAKMDCDLVVYEDSKLHGSFTNRGAVPVAYHVVDSPLSKDHYRARHEQAKWADLILVDYDYLSRFKDLGVPVRRFSYCANDKLFYDRGHKDFDVGSFLGKAPRRDKIIRALHKICKRQGFSFACGRYNYQEYAEMMSRSRIVINTNRVPVLRTHRVFDTMACRSCLLGEPMHDVPGEGCEAGTHYEIFDGDLEDKLVNLLSTGRWEPIANAGYDLVRQRHIWSIRARELREILYSTILN